MSSNVDVQEIKEHILKFDGVKDVHHIHIWSLDGYSNYATMHVVTDNEGHEIKEKVRKELDEHNICHATLELETTNEHCHNEFCHIKHNGGCGHYHHHHH